ncbi:hypothetical protein Pcinc_009398 [Petrolisthes cinctipes]|uniref:ribonuclease H n=1 Tax=Petrolisthes cinctipes TaxID=88211 RepID=A0AAE1KWI1_PETCI|nr:hypothetical protein Pcinc_009398 [Petrolisthes cinctipes]
MSTIRKSEIGNVASASLQQHHYLHHGRRRPLAVRLHQLEQQLQIDLGDCDKFITTKIPPWETPNFGVNTSWLPSSKEKAPELEIHHLFGGIVRSHLGSLHVYTDGSKSDESVGASVWSSECELRYRLLIHTSVFTAELFAIDKAIDYALNSRYDSIVIFSDSMSALQAINSCQTISNEIQGRIINKLHLCNKSFTLIWVPGHCRIYGNERADLLAKSAVELEVTWDVPRDLQSCLSLGKKSINLLWQGQWTRLNINTIKPQLGNWATANRPNRLEYWQD